MKNHFVLRRKLRMDKSQYLNFLAIAILETAGNILPTQAQINQIEAFLLSCQTVISPHRSPKSETTEILSI